MAWRGRLGGGGEIRVQKKNGGWDLFAVWSLSRRGGSDSKNSRARSRRASPATAAKRGGAPAGLKRERAVGLDFGARVDLAGRREARILRGGLFLNFALGPI